MAKNVVCLRRNVDVFSNLRLPFLSVKVWKKYVDQLSRAFSPSTILGFPHVLDRIISDSWSSTRKTHQISDNQREMGIFRHGSRGHGFASSLSDAARAHLSVPAHVHRVGTHQLGHRLFVEVPHQKILGKSHVLRRRRIVEMPRIYGGFMVDDSFNGGFMWIYHDLPMGKSKVP